MRVFLTTILLAIFGMITGGCMGSGDPMETVPEVDLNRYMGDWYVIASMPTFVEKNAVNAIESYALREDGDVDITFTFNDKTPDGKQKQYNARGYIHNRETNAEWRVQFFWPVKFPFMVIDLDPEYEYTVVGVPNRKYVWIMARESHMDEKTLNRIIDRLEFKYGYDRTKIKKVPQEWDTIVEGKNE